MILASALTGAIGRTETRALEASEGSALDLAGKVFDLIACSLACRLISASRCKRMATIRSRVFMNLDLRAALFGPLVDPLL